MNNKEIKLPEHKSITSMIIKTSDLLAEHGGSELSYSVELNRDQAQLLALEILEDMVIPENTSIYNQQLFGGRDADLRRFKRLTESGF